MATIVRLRVGLLAKQGESLNYDGICGATSGNWATDQFIAAVYQEVTQRSRVASEWRSDRAQVDTE